MPTLYVENVPDELYRGLRQRARANRSSIAAKVIALLENNIPTAKELKRREEFYQGIAKFVQPGHTSTNRFQPRKR